MRTQSTLNILGKLLTSAESKINITTSRMPTPLGDLKTFLNRARSVTLESLAVLELLESLSVLDLLDSDRQTKSKDKQRS